MAAQARRDRNGAAPRILDPMSSGDSGVYARVDGPIAHLAADSLERPLELPRSDFRKILPVILVAIALSAALIVAYNVTVLDDMKRTQDLVAQMVARDVTLDLPQMKSYAGTTNEAMLESFKSDGYEIYDNSNDEDRNVDGFDVYKLAGDVDPQQAATAYSQGIENLSDVEAARYLAGSWRFLVSRGDAVEMRLRYADFDSSDPISAIEAALASQGFDDAKVQDAAEDTMGNTNLSGSFEKNKKTYDYTISACDLSQVYDIEGAPASAQYVGIRVTDAS